MWSYLPVTFDGIFTSTNIIKWGINSVGTQYLWSFTQPFIIHCITSRLILNWNTFRQIEKYKWSPSGYFHRYKPKLLSSWASRSPRLQSTSKIAEKPNQIKKKKKKQKGRGRGDLYYYNVTAYIYTEILYSGCSSCLEQCSI